MLYYRLQTFLTLSFFNQLYMTNAFEPQKSFIVHFMYVACVHHAAFYLFLFQFVLKDDMRNNAVMSLGDPGLKERVLNK